MSQNHDSAGASASDSATGAYGVCISNYLSAVVCLFLFACFCLFAFVFVCLNFLAFIFV